ncbi:hypothetical protein OpiT1DRAFT_05957 [Opitutaceae bacterium TAV1]|nr:hypothetical protein OpiT1DRAFT_05957 [Opitutaceae bacterium TAV1]
MTTISSRSCSRSHEPIRIGPFSLHLAFEDGSLTGIGAVNFHNTPLRSALLPWTFYAESETGVRFSRFDLSGVEQKNGSDVTICFRSNGEWLPRIQETDAMGEARIRPRRAQKTEATFRWNFRLIRERVFENEYVGLAMQLDVSSPGNPLHWIIEDATWEIGGEAGGATLIQQDVSTIDLEQRVREDSEFSTVEKFHTDGWGGSYPMDMLPRAAGAAICDFQTKDNLALCLFAERPSLTRARLDKFAGENLIHYTDRAYFPLTENARPPERKLLVYRHPAPLRQHEWRNLWLDCFCEVRRRILAPFGFEPELPRPSLHAHLWDEELKLLGKDWMAPLRDALPAYRKLGYKQIFTHGVWESVTSDPSPPSGPGNICCPYLFRFADAFGGADSIRRLTAAAAAENMDVYQWFSFHLSRHAPVWKEHPDWVMKESGGEPWDASYCTLWSGRFRSAYGEWIRDMVEAACGESALTGIFWDSYQNMGIDCVDWSAPDKAPQADEIWRFQARLQRLGIGQRCEIVTIFGVSAVSMYGFEHDKFRRRLWSDTVRNDDFFALLDTSPGFFTDDCAFVPGRIDPQMYFRLAAHRVVPFIGVRPWKNLLPPNPARQDPLVPGGDLAADYAAVNRLYNEALPHMKRLRLVEGGTHTLWLDEQNRPSALWIFQPVQIKHHGRARELAGGRIIVTDGRLDAAPGEVWLLQENQTS